MLWMFIGCLWITDADQAERLKSGATGVDSGAPDGGTTDGGTTDGGTTDGGTTDSGTPDSGTTDGGTTDGGTTGGDSGTDQIRAYAGSLDVDCTYGTAGLFSDVCAGSLDLDLDGDTATGALSCVFTGMLDSEGTQVATLNGTVGGSGTVRGSVDFEGSAILEDASFAAEPPGDGTDRLVVQFGGVCDPDDDFAGDYVAEATLSRR